MSCCYIADESLLIFLYALESPRAIAPHYPYMYRIVVSYTIIPVVVSLSVGSLQFQLGSGTNQLVVVIESYRDIFHTLTSLFTMLSEKELLLLFYLSTQFFFGGHVCHIFRGKQLFALVQYGILGNGLVCFGAKQHS